MANLATTADCIDYILKQATEKDQGQGSFFEANALLYLNIAQKELASGASRLIPDVVATFPWAKAVREKSIILQPPRSTSTVSVTQNSSTISFFIAPNISLLNYFIKFGTNPTLYKIISHTAGNNAATLDSVYVDTTNGLSTYTAFLLDYSLGSGDILRPVAPFNGYRTNSSGDETNQVDGISEFDFRRAFPTFSLGEPTHFYLTQLSPGTFNVRFSHYPASYSRVDVPYIAIPDDLTITPSSVPIVPINHRLTLCQYALYYLYLDKADDRSMGAYQNAQVGYSVMLREVGMLDFAFEPFKPNSEVKGA
jgi:hypothetical protein